MSGGSHDYLCFADDVYELARKREALERMADDLSVLPWAATAAAETQRLLGALRRLDSFVRSSKPLRDVWYAVEWWQSGDYSEAQAREAAREYETLTDLPGAGVDNG